MEEDFRINSPRNFPRKWIGLIILGIIILVVLFSTFYTVGPDEVGVIKRFGRYMRITDPGLHVKIPFAESVTKVKVKRIFKEEFGFRTLRPGVRTVYTPEKWEDESLMLTGDLNVAVVEWIVQYRIVDPYKYLFKVRDVRKTIRDISEVVMRMVVGDRSVDEVLTVGRMEAATQAQKKLQEILNFYDTGIKIVTVKLKDVNPPDPVKPSFNEVNEARQDRERFINEAWQAYNKVIPKAKGEAEKVIAEAEGYAIKRVNRAQGDANRFLAIWKEYKRAKDVTRKRMYIETLSKVLPRVGKIYVVDSEQKTLLPLLSLEGGKK
ncbi:MAG TPA: FtsH protease activity modulator HflK [Candidatus Aerophobetes bacterium]|uniref:Protein HflK n=1 Tax=Aerophobetes bacterium TaxID=2030807 RepID=A0A7V0N1T4_UNCAE|nr:FtsH protease activity modulator HflK [Candidatus Aerophobetes bacterium]